MADNPGDGTPKVASADMDEATALERLAEVFAEDDGATADLEEPQVRQLVARVLMSEKYEGAFPHPRNLREFDEVVENGAERAFCLTEKEQAHRHSCDNKLIDAGIKAQNSSDFDRRLVIISSMAIAFVGIIGTIVLVALSKNIGASVVGAGSILSGGIGAYLGRSPSKGSDAAK